MADHLTNAEMQAVINAGGIVTYQGRPVYRIADLPSDEQIAADANADILASSDDTPQINAQTGTAYTLQGSDHGGIVTLSNASPVTVTVPAGLGTGFNCLLIQIGAGQVTITAGAGAAIHNRQSHAKIAGQYGIATLAAYAANTFVLGGDTAS